MDDVITNGLNKILETLDLSKLDIKVPNYNFDMPRIEQPAFDTDILVKHNKEKNKREVENNENLKALVQYNEDISNYNKQLVSLNEKILNKINSLDDTLLFLNEAFANKTEIDKEQGQSYNALLLELITIIDSKDGGKLKQFTNGLAAPVLAGLVVEYLKLKLGLSK